MNCIICATSKAFTKMKKTVATFSLLKYLQKKALCEQWHSRYNIFRGLIVITSKFVTCKRKVLNLKS